MLVYNFRYEQKYSMACFVLYQAKNINLYRSIDKEIHNIVKRIRRIINIIISFTIWKVLKETDEYSWLPHSQSTYSGF